MSYRVYISPLIDESNYGEEVDVTSDLSGGLSKIKQSIDNSDFSMGVFSYDSIKLKLNNNHERYSSGFEAYETIFPSGRDRAKVRVEFTTEDGDTINSFNGIIDEIATKEDDRNFRISFRILSTDAIIRKHSIPGAQITNGITFRNAIYRILNTNPINRLLNIDLANINLQFDDIIDDGSWFDSRSAKEAIDLLLLASGSILFVDENLNIIVTQRSTETEDTKTFFSANHPLRKSPVIFDMKSVNTGVQRIFNSIIVNNVRAIDRASVNFFGLKQRDVIEIPFITNQLTSFAIAQLILMEFRYPREEIQIKVLAKEVQELQLTDIVTIDHPKFVTKAIGQKLLPLYGTAIYGKAKYPRERGRQISRSINWVVYEKNEDPKRFEAILKLRKFGKNFGEEYIPSRRYGFAEYKLSKYGKSDPNFINPLELSLPYGSGKYGTVQYQPEI